MCLFVSCIAGQRGCSCLANNIKKCEDGFSCVGGSCVQTTCDIGSPGCRCLTGKKCNTSGFICMEFARDGSQSTCVGQDLCPGTQTERCRNECGANIVVTCGKCLYSKTICQEGIADCNPRGYLYGLAPCPGQQTIFSGGNNDGRTFLIFYSVVFWLSLHFNYRH